MLSIVIAFKKCAAMLWILIFHQKADSRFCFICAVVKHTNAEIQASVSVKALTYGAHLFLEKWQYYILIEFNWLVGIVFITNTTHDDVKSLDNWIN